VRRVTYEELATWTQHAVQVVSFDWMGQQALALLGELCQINLAGRRNSVG
jgi:hypothetical protein